MKLAGVIALLGLAFLGYEKFLDGSFVNPIVVHDMPRVEVPYDTNYFTPIPFGSVLGIYQIKTDKESYKPGEEVFVYLTLCKYREITPTVRWSFINDTVADLGPRIGQLYEPGCYKNKRISIGSVPDELRSSLPGSKYQLHGTITYSVNPIRKVSYLLVSNYFTIDHSEIGEGITTP